MVRAVLLIAISLTVILVREVAPTQAQTFGDWVVLAEDKTSLYAGSTNESGHVFGQFCYPDKGACIWMISLDKACVKDDKYPILANAEREAVHLEILCGAPLEAGRYSYVITNFDQVDALVRKGKGQVGFALPLTHSEFTVVRFNLRGALPALSAMRAEADARMSKGTRSTRDQWM